MARYTKQELIPIDVNMYVKDFHKFLKEYAKKLLQAAVVDKKFGKTVMLPGDSTLLTSANLEIKIDDKESVWNQVRVNQILSSNYNFRTEISSYTAKSAMFDIMAAVEEHRGSSSVVDEKKVDVKSQEEDEVVVMQGYCPCPRLNKLLSNLGMAHHQDAIVKQELTLDLLLSLEPSERLAAISSCSLPYGSQAILCHTLSCFQASVTLKNNPLRQCELVCKTFEKNEIPSVSDADVKDESSSTSPLTQLISSENGDVSIAARILSMLIPSHDFVFKVSKDFCFPQSKVHLGFEEDGRTFCTDRAPFVTAAAQGALGAICASDVEIEAESGVYRWAFAIRSTVGAQFAMFGITSNLPKTTSSSNIFRYPNINYTRGFNFYNAGNNIQRYQTYGALGMPNNHGHFGAPTPFGAGRNQSNVSLNKDDIFGFELDTDQGTLSCWINGKRQDFGAHNAGANNLFRYGAVRPFVLLGVHVPVRIRAVRFPRTPEQSSKILQKVLKDEAAHLDQVKTKLQAFGFEDDKIKAALEKHHGVFEKAKKELSTAVKSKTFGTTTSSFNFTPKSTGGFGTSKPTGGFGTSKPTGGFGTSGFKPAPKNVTFGSSSTSSTPKPNSTAGLYPGVPKPAPKNVTFGSSSTSSTPKPNSTAGLYPGVPKPAPKNVTFGSSSTSSTPKPNSTAGLYPGVPKPAPKNVTFGSSSTSSTPKPNSTGGFGTPGYKPAPKKPTFGFSSHTSSTTKPKPTGGFTFANTSSITKPRPTGGFTFANTSSTTKPRPTTGGFTFSKGSSNTTATPKPPPSNTNSSLK
eukprot:g742.t1